MPMDTPGRISRCFITTLAPAAAQDATGSAEGAATDDDAIVVTGILRIAVPAHTVRVGVAGRYRSLPNPRNVGIGRETDSLMMMVTPRIIIQEEEEALLGISPTP